MRRDEEARQTVAALRGTPRWTRSTSDAVLSFPQVADTFSCAAGVAISPETTPRLYGLMSKMLIDVGLSTYAAKNHYQRTRPFVAHEGPTCTPGDEAMLRTDGSYPSGHSALGWGWALVTRRGRASNAPTPSSSAVATSARAASSATSTGRATSTMAG